MHPYQQQPFHPPAPPEPPERPESIRLAIQLWAAVIVCQAIAAISLYPVMHREARPFAEDYLEQSGASGDVGSAQTLMAVGATVVQIVVLGGLSVLVMVFAFRGRSWARLLLGWMSAFLAVLLVFDIIGLLVGVDDDSMLSVPDWGMVPRILGGVAAMGALAALMNKDSARYCRETAEFRSRTKPGRGGR